MVVYSTKKIEPTIICEQIVCSNTKCISQIEPETKVFYQLLSTSQDRNLSITLTLVSAQLFILFR